jgi:hypothetical protein
MFPKSVRKTRKKLICIIEKIDETNYNCETCVMRSVKVSVHVLCNIVNKNLLSVVVDYELCCPRIIK